MEAGWKLNEIVARKLGWNYEPRFEGDTTGYWNSGVERYISEEMPAFSIDMEDVMMVVDFVEGKYGPCLELTHYAENWLCEFRNRATGRGSLGLGRGSTAPLAICNAFLRIGKENQ
jgi:hypothetical protein